MTYHHPQQSFVPMPGLPRAPPAAAPMMMDPMMQPNRVVPMPPAVMMPYRYPTYEEALAARNYNFHETLPVHGGGMRMGYHPVPPPPYYHHQSPWAQHPLGRPEQMPGYYPNHHHLTIPVPGLSPVAPSMMTPQQQQDRLQHLQSMEHQQQLARQQQQQAAHQPQRHGRSSEAIIEEQPVDRNSDEYWN